MNTRSLGWLASLLAAAVLSACGGAGPAATQPPSSGQQQTITVSGAFALYPMMVTWADEYQKLHPNVRIDVSAGGAGKGMADALAGAVEIGMVSRNVTDEEKGKGAYPIGVTRDAVFGVVNSANPVLADVLKTGISQETLKKIYITGEIKTWGEVVGKPEVKDEIHVYTRSDSAGAAEMWAKYMGGKAQDDLKGIGVNGDPGILEAVVKDPLGIGYNNLNYAFDPTSGKPVTGAVILPLDANKNGAIDPDEVLDAKDKAVSAVATGKYPSPPARVLYLVTKGEPTGATRDFIKWILADGQKFVAPTGYIALTAAELATEQARVK